MHYPIMGWEAEGEAGRCPTLVPAAAKSPLSDICIRHSNKDHKVTSPTSETSSAARHQGRIITAGGIHTLT